MTEAPCPRTYVGYLKLHLPLNLNCESRECKLNSRVGFERVGACTRDEERRRESVVGLVKERRGRSFPMIRRKIDRQLTRASSESHK